VLTMLHFPGTVLNTMIYIRDDQYFLRSDAGLEIFRGLTGLWPLLYVFIVCPRYIRDFVYTILAKNRYRWFGKKAACLVPSSELKSLFLD